MTFEQKDNIILSVMISAALIIIFYGLIYFLAPPTKPIESTWQRVLSCTVKSNIEGVITLNDDCKITVIGEE